MDGAQKFDVDGDSGFVVTQVMERSSDGASSGTASSAVGTGSGLSISMLFVLMGRGEIIDMMDSFGRIRAIFTGTGHC